MFNEKSQSQGMRGGILLGGLWRSSDAKREDRRGGSFVPTTPVGVISATTPTPIPKKNDPSSVFPGTVPAAFTAAVGPPDGSVSRWKNVIPDDALHRPRRAPTDVGVHTAVVTIACPSTHSSVHRQSNNVNTWSTSGSDVFILRVVPAATRG